MPRKNRRRSPVDIALQLMYARRRHTERLQRLVASRALRTGGGVLLALVLLVGGWWLLAPSLVVRLAAEALQQGQVEQVETFVDPERVAAAFFDEWAAVAALTAEGTPRAVSLSVKPEAVRHLTRLYRMDMARARSGKPWLLSDAEIRVAHRISARAVQDIPIRVVAGATEVQFHARVMRQGLVWRIVEMPGAVAALAQLLEP